MVTMLDCIRRVPERVEWILDGAGERMNALVSACTAHSCTPREIVVVGSGTSNTAALTARGLMQRFSGIRVTATIPSEFEAEKDFYAKDALCVFVSQTGTSKLTLNALLCAKEQGFLTVALSKDAHTPVAEAADVFMDMGCGEEEYPMRTIGYSTSVVTLILLAAALGVHAGSVQTETARRVREELRKSAERIEETIENTILWLQKERRTLMRSDLVVFTGAGELAGVAMEAAVKMWETPQIATFHYELEEGMHAPNFGYSSRHCVLVLNNGGRDSEKAKSLCRYVKNELHTGFMIGSDTLDEHDLKIPAEGEMGFLCSAAAVQTIAYQLAVDQGRDLFAPRDWSVMNSYFTTHSGK